MEAEDMRKYRASSLQYCEKLLNEVKRDRDDVDMFFGGELYDAYVNAVDEVLNKTIKIRTKIRNL